MLIHSDDQHVPFRKHRHQAGQVACPHPTAHIYVRSNPADGATPENRPRFVSTNNGGSGLPRPLMASSSLVPRDDARMELCGAGLAFS
jgi:hypothetical protein